MRWYERVRRRYRLTAERRGAYDFGPVLLSSGDIFGFRTRLLEVPTQQTVLVYPRLVPLNRIPLRVARPGGELLGERRIVEDPLRLAGVRDYKPGDPVRHIHWKSSARIGQLQTKVFEPAASQHLVIFLNGQTLEHAYEGVLGDYFETAIMVAAALANAGLEARHPVGLFTNNSVRDASRRVRLPASRHSLANGAHARDPGPDDALHPDAARPVAAPGSAQPAVWRQPDCGYGRGHRSHPHGTARPARRRSPGGADRHCRGRAGPRPPSPCPRTFRHTSSPRIGPNLKRLNWIEELLLPPAVAVLNTTWVWLWVLWSVRAVPPEVAARPFSPLLLGLLVLGGFAVTRWSLAAVELPRPGASSADPASQRRARLLIAGAGAGAGIRFGLANLCLHWPARPAARAGRLGQLHFARCFLGLVACAFLWYQGIQLGRSALPQENLERAFYGGIFALGLLFAVNQLRPLIATSEALTAALAFFATGLAGLAMVSVENARRAEEGLTGSWPALNRYWLGTVASVIGSILLAGLLLASILSPQTFERIAGVLNVIVDGVTIGIVILAGTLAFLLAWLLAPLFRYLAEALKAINFTLPPAPNLQQTTQQTLSFFERYPALNFARRGLVLAVIVAAMVLVFWWAVRRFTGRARRDADETRENIATRELLMAQLKICSAAAIGMALLRRPTWRCRAPTTTRASSSGAPIKPCSNGRRCSACPAAAPGKRPPPMPRPCARPCRKARPRLRLSRAPMCWRATPPKHPPWMWRRRPRAPSSTCARCRPA